MISLEALEAAGIPIKGTDDIAALQATAALEWIEANTSLSVDFDDPEGLKELPATAKLFVSKYVEVLSLKPGVSSQSIEGLSISFDTTDKSAMLWQLASTLLGSYLRQCRVFPAKRRW